MDPKQGQACICEADTPAGACCCGAHSRASAEALPATRRPLIRSLFPCSLQVSCVLLGAVLLQQRNVLLRCLPRFLRLLKLPAAQQVLPGGRLLASADEAGGVAVHDLRALGAPDGGRALLWHARPGSGGITSLAAGLRPHSGAPFLVRCRALERGQGLKV